MDIQYLQNVLVASRAYLKSHRDLASRFMKGFVEGVAYFKRNKEDSMRILIAVLPMLAMVITFWAISRYPLHGEKLTVLKQRLTELRANAGV